MTDKKLLELAAKAAGVTRQCWDYDWVRGLGHMVTRNMMWNPLVNDGEALRLAIETGITIDAPKDWGFVYAGGQGSFSEPIGDDKMAAVRRAIVRAAADIGKAMP
jgi:hypothetical protein